MDAHFPKLGQTLYHGSYIEVRRPDITRGEPQKDFGQGFYTTSLLKTAQAWAVTSARRRNLPNSVVSSYTLDAAAAKLAVYRFGVEDTILWFDFVVKNRYPDKYYPYVSELYDNVEKYDTIIGFIADDTTNIIFRDFFSATDGSTNREEIRLEKEYACSRLIREELKEQVFFRTQFAADMLRYAGRT
jgi:hypothetical protein